MKLKLYTFVLFSLTTFTIQAQLFIDNSYTPEEMVLDFFSNSCVTPSNIIYTGSDESIAFFDAGNSDLGTQAGIYLSTGNVFSAIGPNTAGGTSGNMGTAGDADLDALGMGMTSNDGAVLEMDIFVTGTQLDFSYVFASEEYPEFVSSGFNDIFAFFISGPGIIGMQNIAMVPGTSDPVTINTINDQTNAQYYVDNTGGQDIEFDGFTTELIASAAVTANETYHIKIAIADVGDAVFDSGIFLGIESLCGDPMLTPPAQSNLTVEDMTVTFENLSKYATSYFWDFGDNATSTEKDPAPHTYAADGIYEVKLITYNYCCSDTLTTSITVGNPNAVEEIDTRPYFFSPNPVKDQAQLSFYNGGNFEVKVFDTTGKIISNEFGSSSSELDFSQLSTGVYFLEIKVEDKIYREKFLKL